MNITRFLLLVSIAASISALSPRASGQQPQRTVVEIQHQVDALAKEDVAWRKIEWKTCLLDGLHASREQGKPMIVWIFIDRPIDDERC